MRVTLVEASSLKNIRSGEGRFTLDNTDGKAVILTIFERMPTIKVNLQIPNHGDISRYNASNQKRYVGVAQLEVDFYNWEWAANTHFTAIYTLHEDEPHSRIFLFASPHKVDAVKLTETLLDNLAKGLPVDSEYPVLVIKQALKRRLDLALREMANA